MHALFPMLFLLAFFPKLSKKYVFYLLPLVWIIDLDTYIGGTHRYLFHNLLAVILISVVVYFIWDKKAFFVTLFYTGCHLIFDLAYPGVALFYPFVQKTFYISANLLHDSSGWIWDFGWGTVAFADLPLGTSHYFTTWGMILLITLAIVLIAKGKGLKNFFKNWHYFFAVNFTSVLFHNIAHKTSNWCFGVSFDDFFNFFF